MTTLVKSGSVGRLTWQRHVSWWAWLCSAISLAFVQAIPTIPAVIFLGIVSIYCALLPARVYRALLWNFIPWMIVGFGALSAIWSDVPMHSARCAAQIGLTTLVAIMFAQNLPAYSYIAVVMYAFLAPVVASLYLPGIFGSKNSLALAIALVILSSCWVMVDKQQPKITRIVALLALLGSPMMLFAADSQGALLSGGLALLCSFLPFLFRSLRSSTRIFLFWLAVFGTVISLVMALWVVDSVFDIALTSIGKDATLTGRTVLWSQAIDLIANHPFGGLGLQAFWVERNRAAERLWAFFFINSRAGFHFHNLWLETGVELGLIGLALAFITTLVVVSKVFQWMLNDPRPESCFFAGFTALVIFRTFGEVELYVQFFIVPMIFLAGYYYAFSARSTHLSSMAPSIPAHERAETSLVPLTT